MKVSHGINILNSVFNMKKLSKLVLMNLEAKELSQRQMNQIKGGNSCGCGCCYAGGGGGSSASDNGLANCKGSQSSYACGGGDWAGWGC